MVTEKDKHTGWRQGRFIDGPEYSDWTPEEKAAAPCTAKSANPTSNIMSKDNAPLLFISLSSLFIVIGIFVKINHDYISSLGPGLVLQFQHNGRGSPAGEIIGIGEKDQNVVPATLHLGFGQSDRNIDADSGHICRQGLQPRLQHAI